MSERLKNKPGAFTLSQTRQFLCGYLKYLNISEMDS